ncbi:hypothetical protein DFQ28_010635 [Apophysomyces sp. BC1034]|nr:hypothetical protein DFQ28_010635 [Apophysomyces sp. BC1034]
MKSPARMHFERASAAQAAAAHADTMAGATRYELMLAKLATDRRRLKAIQSVKHKIAVKAELLPEYAEYVAGVLDAGRGAQDDVLMTVMVWRIDAGDYVGALAIADYAVRYGLVLPDPYERPLAGVLAEEFAEAALAAFSSGHPFDTGWLERVQTLTEGADMHDPIRAKLFKALGLAVQHEHPKQALGYLRQALALNERAGPVTRAPPAWRHRLTAVTVESPRSPDAGPPPSLHTIHMSLIATCAPGTATATATASLSVIANDGWFPDIDLASVRATMRLDGTVTPERLRDALIAAVARANATLAAWRDAQQAAGYARLADVPAAQVDGKSVQLARYRRAICHLVHADLAARYRDFDATASGHAKADALEATVDEARRIAHWALNDLQGMARTTVELI